MTAVAEDDRELWAVLVALAPLDGRKWRYLDVQRRTFNSEAMLDEPWSSGERVLIEVAASLWNEGRVDLGYVACALGERHLQAVVDAVSLRAGRPLMSDVSRAVRGVTGRPDRPDGRARDRSSPSRPPRRDHGLER